MNGAPTTRASASSSPSPACSRMPARCTAPARASSSAVSFETPWIVPWTTVLLTIETKLLTTAKSPKSAAPTMRVSRIRCSDPLIMKKTFAKPMNITPRPTVLAAVSGAALAASALMA